MEQGEIFALFFVFLLYETTITSTLAANATPLGCGAKEL